MTAKPLLLLIDSDAQTSALLNEALANSGCEMIVATTGQEALLLLETHKPALVILDLLLADQSGWEVLREVRTRSQAPLLILSALAGEAEQLAALDGGAADFILKPFSVLATLARIEAVLRRIGQGTQKIVRRSLTLDPSDQHVTVDGEPITLTDREFALLRVLAGEPGRAFSRSELLARCWEQSFHGTARVIDVHLASLRRKLGRQRNLIFTVRGVGYKLAFSELPRN